MSLMQRALALIYPDQCVLCSELVAENGGLCPACWRDTPFIVGLACELCGAPLPGDGEGTPEICDDCRSMKRPWARGRAALAYRGGGRRLVLGLKHGDRTDIVPAAAKWMARAGRDLLEPDTLLVPVPIHWRRLLRRRYNQAAELARAIARVTGHDACPDALVRMRATPRLEGMTVDERIAAVEDSMAVRPRCEAVLRGRRVCLVDDVMTSGATLGAAARAIHASGATRVSVLVLARAVKEP